jgi:alcohol dehydrogenase class IV
MIPFSYFVPTKIVCGPGVVDSLGERVKKIGVKPMVVTGKCSARKSGALDRVLKQLPNAIVFDSVEENPTAELCEDAARICADNGCDFLVAIGGGSPMDAAKAIAALARNPGVCDDFYGSEKIAGGALPIVAIPTTAGTGSEVTPYSVLVKKSPRKKQTIGGAALFPALALLDPELSITMPRSVTVNTGLDALSQAMEGLVSLRSTPMGDILAYETCRIVRRWLPMAASDPANVEARMQMLFAAALSGCVIAQSGTTLVHGMGYYYTLEHGLAHGLANALLLTPAFQFNAGAIPEKVARISEALGVPSDPDPESARKSIGDALHALLNELDVSPAAKDWGVEPALVQKYAEEIFADRSRFKNQPGEPTIDDVFQIFTRSCHGQK